MIEMPRIHPDAPSLTRRNLLIGGALVATAGIAYARRPVAQPGLMGKDKIDALIPKAIGPWQFETASGLVLPPPDQLKDQLYSDLATRVYYAPNERPMMLLIAYSGVQDGMLQVHRPETCYSAGGYTLSDSRMMDLPVARGAPLPVRFLTATSNERTEQMIYWTRVGPAFPMRWVDQRMAVLRENLAGRIPDGLLVRVSTISQEPADAIPAMERFIGALVAGVPLKGRKLLLGPTAVA